MASFPPLPLMLVLFNMGEVADKTFWVEVGNCCRRDVEDWKEAIIIIIIFS